MGRGIGDGTSEGNCEGVGAVAVAVGGGRGAGVVGGEAGAGIERDGGGVGEGDDGEGAGIGRDGGGVGEGDDGEGEAQAPNNSIVAKTNINVCFFILLPQLEIVHYFHFICHNFDIIHI
ncbi:hypothetical protein ACFLWG_03640 [Chloroflexota bacterium]